MFAQLPSTSRVPALYPTTPEGASSGAELVTRDGKSLALVSAKLVGEAHGGLARLVLEQTFANSYDSILNVTYRMPLPADGAVSGYEFVIGERTITGVVEKKQKAREKYEAAIASGHTAALLEQERADIFTQRLGNVPPHERVTARITIDQKLVWLPEGEWELRFPTVIGPRYIGTADTLADARATHIKVTDQPRAVTFQIELAIGDAITGGAKPQSPSHALVKQGDRYALTSGARLDRDIIVRWAVAAAAPGLMVNTARGADGSAYGLVTIVPPARAAHQVSVARDLLILLDTSGSMSGGPLDKAKQVIALMIDSLGETDRLEVIEFSDSPRRWKREPVDASAKAKAEAIAWVRARQAGGATEMRTAVIESLATLRIGAQRQVLLVTDGYVGGEQQILEALHRRLPASCRLHVLGVGAAVNRSLATSLARAGRGAEVLVGIDEDAERGAKRLLDRTKRPMLTNVEIAGSALLRHAPEKIPDVFEGAPLVAALALEPMGGELVVRGQTAEGAWHQTIAVPAREAGQGNQAIAKLYGRERVADVEAHAMFDSVTGEIEELGLVFQIATRMTSWVAVDYASVVKGPSRDEVVPQELPYGTTAGAFGLRAAGSGRVASAALMELALADESAPSETLFGSAQPQISTPYALARPSSVASIGGAPPARSPSFVLDHDDEFADEVDTGSTQLDAARAAAAPKPAQSAPLLPAAVKEEIGRTPRSIPQQQPPQALGQVGHVAKPIAPLPPAKTSMRWMILASILAALVVIALLWWFLLA